MKEKKVEMVPLPYVFNVGETLHLVIGLAKGANKSIDAEAMFPRALPMLIDEANRKLHPHGLHLAMQNKEPSTGKARLFHRADGKTPGTKNEKARRVKEVLEEESYELLEALVQPVSLRNAKGKTKHISTSNRKPKPKKKARGPSQPTKRLKRTLAAKRHRAINK